jgi:hypothetical protein
VLCAGLRLLCFIRLRTMNVMYLRSLRSMIGDRVACRQTLHVTKCNDSSICMGDHTHAG